MSISSMSEPTSSAYYDEENKLMKKAREQPFFPIAILGCTAAVIYGAYKFKHRGAMSPSVFLMQLRVGAQGVAVGSLTLGLIYGIVNEHFLKKKE